ncbi:hypothetical protein [Pseudomonas migulae]
MSRASVAGHGRMVPAVGSMPIRQSQTAGSAGMRSRRSVASATRSAWWIVGVQLLVVIASLVKRQRQLLDRFRVFSVLNVFAFVDTFDAAIDQAASISGPVGKADKYDQNYQCADLSCSHVVCS